MKMLTSCLGVVNLLNVSEHHAECFLAKISNIAMQYFVRS